MAVTAADPETGVENVVAVVVGDGNHEVGRRRESDLFGFAAQIEIVHVR